MNERLISGYANYATTAEVAESSASTPATTYSSVACSIMVSVATYITYKRGC